MNEYKHQLQTPTALKIEGREGNPISKYIIDEMGQTEKMKSIIFPTRMNIMRFIQDFTDKYCNDGIGNYIPVDEATILEALDKFFGKFTH